MALPTLPFFRKAEPQEMPAIEAASLRSDRFRLERQTDWERLEAIVTRLEKNRPGGISDADLLDLPVLYRQAASSLAVARETTLDAATLAYLESLVRRAWFQVHGPRVGLFGWLRQFFGGGWSAAVRALWLETCIALAVMVVGTLVGYFLVARNSDWYYSLVPGQFANQRRPGASREDLLVSLSTEENANGLGIFAAQLFSNNAGVAIMAFALGFCFGVPTVLLLVYNTALLGAMWWVFQQGGLPVEFTAWLFVHGSTEFYAILLSGAAGLHVGRSMAFPGNRSVMQALSESGQRAAVVMAGVVIMMVLAGLLEAYPRQLVGSVEGRFAVGGAMLTFWLAYFYLFRRRAAS